MAAGIRLSLGQHSEPGRKTENQDFFGAIVPDGRLLAIKGAAAVVADGISTSRVGRVAAETAVRGFLSDYFCTPDSWSARTSGQAVIAAVNSWLHAQTRRSGLAYDRDRGFVCTFSALIIKGRRAHVFHVGDSRVWRLRDDGLEQLTTDHRVRFSGDESYLGRALGLAQGVEIEYRDIDVRPGDTFVLSTDGVHEHVAADDIVSVIADSGDPDRAARQIVERALANGSADNLTLQIVRVDDLPSRAASTFIDNDDALPPPPLPKVGTEFEGYRIERQIHASARSHIYLAVDTGTGARVAIKFPSLDRRGDPAYLRHFALEEWVARRIESPHVLSAGPMQRERRHLYVVTEYVEGRTLRQWMLDNPERPLALVRDIVVQIAKGLQAFHRLEMLHQDLRPENVLVDDQGTVRIIDFGSVSVAGVTEAAPGYANAGILGTVQYTAPEYFLGRPGTERSDLFSLGVIAYELITRRLPYGTQAARVRTARDQARLRYRPAVSDTFAVPVWVDAALRRAVQPNPARRYEALTELTTDLHRPNPAFMRDFVPLAERDPVRFWQIVAVFFALLCAILLIHGI